MAIVSMKKLSVIGLNSKRTAFLHELMHLGVIQVNSRDGVAIDEEWMPDIFRASNSADASRMEADLARVGVALDAIGTYDGDKKPLFRTREEVDREVFITHMNNVKTETEMNVDTAVIAQRKIADDQNELNRLGGLIQGLKPWVRLEVPLEDTETEFACMIMGTVGVKVNFQEALTTLLEEVPSAVAQEIDKDEQQRYVFVVCLKKEKEKVYEVLQKFSFAPIAFQDCKGTASEMIAVYEAQTAECTEDIELQIKTLQNLASAKRNMQYLYDSLHMRLDRAKIVSEMLSTDTAFYFDGWLPERSIESAGNLLKQYECYYEITEPDAEEPVPVLLKNSALATPFEAITQMYSLPGRSDIDPTTLMAPFYFIFFGMMLSDAAYGIILSIICWVILKKYKLEGMTYKMIKMFFFCGISTFCWGVLFGGWFGNFFTVFAEVVLGKEFVITPLLFDPLAKPMELLVISLILGAVHLFLGMAIQAYMLIRDGKPFDALCDIGLWYVILIGLVLFGIGGSIGPTVAVVGKWMSIIGAVGIIVTGGRAKEGIVGKLTGGLGSLYGITSYLSDVLSYSRLLALGLATGVVAQVINTLGSLAGGGVVGAAVLLIALVVGTIFNMAINALGAFVHTCRLQYVEFFGKFYTGGGKAFAPFERKTKYIRILKEEENHGSR